MTTNGTTNGTHRPQRGRSTATPPTTPRQAAEHFWKLGLNITAIPEGSKKPSHDWDNPDAPWGSERQPLEFIDSIKWPSKSVLYNGKWYRAIHTIGLICGINGVRGFDIDAVKDANGQKIAVPESVRDAVLTALGLDPSYPWAGRSSSGTGWHIVIRCDGELPTEIAQAVVDRKAANGGGTGVKIGLPTAAFAGTFAQLELRWAHCQMALPSPTGYTGTLPDDAPALVTVEALTAAFFAVAVPKPTSKHAKSVEKDRDIRETRSVGEQHTRIDLDRAIADLDLAFTGDQIVRWFVSELGGEPVPESQDQTRILGNSGLLVQDDGRWFAHGDETGSAGWVGAVAYTRYGGTVPHGRDYIALVRTAAEFCGVPLWPAQSEQENDAVDQNLGIKPLLTLADRLAGQTVNEDGAIVTDPAAAARTLTWAQDAIHHTDLGNARRLVRQFGNQIRYVHTWGAWLIYDGTRWVKDETGQIHRLARETVRAMYAETQDAEDSDTRKAIAKWCMASESAGKLAAMVDIARSEPGVAVHHTALDTDQWLLNCRNGTLDLRTGTLQPHNRADLITRRVDVDFAPQAAAPTWCAFITRITEGRTDLASYIQRAIGYTLTGSTREQCLFFLHGEGANGKSTLIEALSALMGDYWSKAPTEMVMLQRFGPGIPNDLARLPGKRMVCTGEISQGRTLDEGKIKDVTGEDTISARFMREEWFDFRPVFKLWMFGNHKPRIKGDDPGMWRRVRMIPFTATITDAEKDTELPAKLRAERTGILTWAVAGCLQWQRDGLQAPELVATATAAYRAESDTTHQWIDACCVVQPTVSHSATPLYSSYKAWCLESGEIPLSQREFSHRLDKRGMPSKRTGKGFFRQGITLIDENRLDLDAENDPMIPNDPKCSINEGSEISHGSCANSLHLGSSDHSHNTPAIISDEPPMLRNPAVEDEQASIIELPEGYKVLPDAYSDLRWGLQTPHGWHTTRYADRSEAVAAAWEHCKQHT